VKSTDANKKIRFERNPASYGLYKRENQENPGRHPETPLSGHLTLQQGTDL